MRSDVKARIASIYPIFLVMASACIAIGYIIQRHFDWGDDAGLYIMQAKCLTDGTPLEDLYLSNKYLMRQSLFELGPYLYPMGTPILLSVVIYFFGVNFFAMKIMCALFLIATIPLMYYIFIKHTKNKHASIFGLLLIFINFYYVKEADSINSDMPFFFFSILSLYLMTERMNIMRGITLGLLVFASYITRDIGLFLLPALFTKQVVDYIYNAKSKNIRTEILPYLVFSILFATQKMIISYGQENHYQMLLENIGLSLFMKNIYYYKIQMGRYFINGDIPTILLLFMLTFTALGMYAHWKQSPHLIVFPFLVLIILLLWPHYQGPRLILPIIPFFILYTILGFQKASGSFKFTKSLFLTLASVFLVFVTYLNVQSMHTYHVRTSDIKLIQSTQYTIGYIRSNIPDSSIIGFRDPRALTMHTGKKAIYTDIKHFDSSVAHFLLIRDSSYTEEKYPKYNNLKLEGTYVLLKKK